MFALEPRSLAHVIVAHRPGLRVALGGSACSGAFALLEDLLIDAQTRPQLVDERGRFWFGGTQLRSRASRSLPGLCTEVWMTGSFVRKGSAPFSAIVTAPSAEQTWQGRSAARRSTPREYDRKLTHEPGRQGYSRWPAWKRSRRNRANCSLGSRLGFGIEPRTGVVSIALRLARLYEGRP
jgi:hypothetical protein